MANEGTDNYRPDPKKEELFEELSRRYEREKQNREKHIVELELTPELEQSGIGGRFAFYADTNAIHISLNHQYTRKSIVFSVDKKDWNKTHNIFEKQLKQKGISKEHIMQLSDVLDNNHEVILSLRDGEQEQEQQEQKENGEDKDKQQKHKRRYATYKYSAKGADTLHEAILLAGQPTFIIYDKDNNEIKAVQNLEEATRILVPPSAEEYPYEPYQFTTIEEVRAYVSRAKEETIDSLYQKSKSIVHKYNDQDEHKLTLLAADIIWSYFQDKFSTTHYVAIVGGNGSGKTTKGDTFAAVAYRTVTMTDPSAANIFRVLGRIEFGQCTIVMDEAEKIDKSPDTMSILKSGYQFNAKVSKISMNEEVQQWFYPYCLKIIIAERSPSQSDAKGVLDRTFLYTAYKGKPQYDIKEILNPAGDQQRQKLFDEIMDFRKLMLLYRLLHFHDAVPDIDVGLEGRDKELCKPLLQLFYNTKSYKEIRATLQIFLNAKNQKKSNLIEAALHPMIVNFVSRNGREVAAKHVWNEIICGSIIEGHFDEKRPNEYQSADTDTDTDTDTDEKNTNTQPNDYEKSSNNKTDIRNIATQNDHKDVIVLEQPSLSSWPSADEVVEQQTPDSIYRIGHSDLFGCNYCKIKGDKPFMVKHPQYCKAGNHSKQNSEVDKKVI